LPSKRLSRKKSIHFTFGNEKKETAPERADFSNSIPPKQAAADNIHHLPKNRKRAFTAPEEQANDDLQSTFISDDPEFDALVKTFEDYNPPYLPHKRQNKFK
jgi:hypothetical protein